LYTVLPVHLAFYPHHIKPLILFLHHQESLRSSYEREFSIMSLLELYSSTLSADPNIRKLAEVRLHEVRNATSNIGK
jgi:hypothetical protein